MRFGVKNFIIYIKYSNFEALSKMKYTFRGKSMRKCQILEDTSEFDLEMTLTLRKMVVYVNLFYLTIFAYNTKLNSHPIEIK